MGHQQCSKAFLKSITQELNILQRTLRSELVFCAPKAPLDKFRVGQPKKIIDGQSVVHCSILIIPL